MAVRSAGGLGRRHALSVKLLDELKQKLEAAAAYSGKTVSNEIETRIAQSFGGSSSVPDSVRPGTDELLEAIRNIIDAAELDGPYKGLRSANSPGSRWVENDHTRHRVRRAIQEVVRIMMGEDEPERPAVLIRQDGTEVEGYDWGKIAAFQALESVGWLRSGADGSQPLSDDEARREAQERSKR